MRKLSFAAGILALLHHTAMAQLPDWTSVFTQINQEVLAHSQAYNTLRQATTTIGHRLTGSANGKKAEEYAFQLLKSYGFADVKYQPFEVESWSRETVTVGITTGIAGQALQTIKAVSLAHSPVKADVARYLVDMGNGVEDDYTAASGKVKGKIALVYLGVLPGSKEGTPHLHRSEKTAIAMRNGAAGILFINAVPDGVLLTGTASVTGKLITIPAVCIGKEDGMALKQQLATQKLLCHIRMTNFSGKIKARNIIATIPGTTLPQEKIVIGGHLDSWDLATGAIDNGIGSFSVIDMARTFQTLHLRPARTIEFVLFMGEEEGLLGSKAYIRAAEKDKSFEHIRYMLNYDMVNDPKGVSTTAGASKELFQYIGSIAHSLDTSFTNSFTEEAGLHSDHQPFMLKGIPTAEGAGGQLPNGALACYHADCDNFSLVDAKGMQNTVRFTAMLLYGIADAPTLKAKRFTDTETRDFLLKNKLKEPLQLAGEWRWGK